MHLTFCAERKKGSPIRLRNKFNDPRKKPTKWMRPLVVFFRWQNQRLTFSALPQNKWGEVFAINPFQYKCSKVAWSEKKKPENRHLDAKSRTYVPLQDGRGRHGLEECMLHKLPLQRWLFTQKNLWRKVHRKNVFYTIYTYVVKRSSDEISVMRGRGGEHKRMDNFLTR